MMSFGREEAVSACLELLATPECRLLTVIGIGGIGKTHLAQQVAQRAEFPDGVFWIALAPQDDIFTRLAGVLPIENMPLADYVREREMLLIFDGAEQITDAAQAILSLLDIAPSSKILVTSREVLSLKTEWVRPLDGLAISSAVQLFYARAAQISTPTPTERPLIQQICEQVGGHPLAIELLAGWRKTLTYAEILAQLQHSLDFLSSQWKDAPPQQRSLRAVWEWTWARLSTAEKTLLQNLTIFRDSFDLAAVVEIAGATLPLLQSLVDKALLEQPYTLHPVIRHYAAATIPAETADKLLTRHTDYYLKRLGELNHDLKHHQQRTAIKSIQQSWAEFRAAWETALNTPDDPALENGAESLLLFFTFTGRIQEGQAFFQRSWQQLSAGSLLWSRLIAGWIQLITWEGRLATNENIPALLEKCPADGYYWRSLAHLTISKGDLTQAITYLEKSRTYFVDDSYQQVQLLRLLTYCYLELEPAEAGQQTLDHSLQLARQIGDQVGEAAALMHQGTMYWNQGDLTSAESAFQEALRLQLEIGNGGRIIYCGRNLAFVLHEQGKKAAAIQVLDQIAPYVEAGSINQQRYQKARDAISPNLPEPLSQREIQVLRLIAAGLKNEDIAAQLVITPGTTKIHIHRIMGKLEVKNRVQAVAKARQLGIL